MIVYTVISNLFLDQLIYKYLFFGDFQVFTFAPSFHFYFKYTFLEIVAIMTKITCITLIEKFYILYCIF